MNARLLLWWYLAGCGCQWFRHGSPCWLPCPAHLNRYQARWC